MSRSYRIKRLEELVREFLVLIGEDPEREGLKETPGRVARMWLEELAYGYDKDPEDLLKTFSNEDNNEENIQKISDAIVISGIPVRSMCEHHLLPIIGQASIAYIPSDRVLGFSKFARIVDVFSRRLQIQERLTNQIADFIYENLRARGVIVLIRGIHLCAFHRGVKEPLITLSRAVRGVFVENDSLRREIMNFMIRELYSREIIPFEI
ncbi:MAG: GTP cyclohydrolase I [Sulfolobales archaeon]